MKTAVIYNSQTGFTKKYAEWISEATGADCFEIGTAKKQDLIDTMLLFLEDGRVQAESVKYHGSSLIWINGWTKC